MGAVVWFARNRVAANLLMLLILLGGLATLPGIDTQIFPEISADLVLVIDV